MTPFPYSIDVDAPLADADALMRAHAIRHLPVTEGDKLVGVVSQRDLLVARAARPGADVDAEVNVREVHTPDPYVVDLEEALDNVLAVMAARHIGSVLVTRRGKLAGVFTATDACHHFCNYLRQQFRPSGGDDAA